MPKAKTKMSDAYKAKVSAGMKKYHKVACRGEERYIQNTRGQRGRGKYVMVKTGDLKKLRAEKKALEEKVVELEADLELAETTEAEIEEEIGERYGELLEEEKEKMRKEIKAIKAKSGNGAEVAKLNKKIGVLEKQIREQIKRSQKKLNEVIEFKNKAISELRAQLRAPKISRSSEREAVEAIMNARSKQDTAERKARELTNRVKGLEKRLTETKKEKKALEEKAGDKIRELEAKVKRTKDTYDRQASQLQLGISARDNRNKLVERRLRELLKENSKLEDKIEALKAKKKAKK